MAEVEYGGIKIGGSKLLLLIPLLGTIGGGLWGGFELWTRYQQMEVKINKYVAPDLSGFDKKLAVLRADMDALQKIEKIIEDSAIQTRDEAREIKHDLKAEIVRTEKIVEQVERRVKGIQDDTRKMIDKENDRNDKLRERIQNRMDSVEDSLTAKMKTLDSDINNKVKKALNNPLSKM